MKVIRLLALLSVCYAMFTANMYAMGNIAFMDDMARYQNHLYDGSGLEDGSDDDITEDELDGEYDELDDSETEAESDEE